MNIKKSVKFWSVSGIPVLYKRKLGNFGSRSKLVHQYDAFFGLGYAE